MNNMNNNYISIKEFAERANLSKRTVYRMVDKELKQFCQTIDSRKCIDMSALMAISKKFGKVVTKDCDNLAQRCDNVDKMTQVDDKMEPIDFSKMGAMFKSKDGKVAKDCDNDTVTFDKSRDKMIDILSHQLEEKDKQIEELQALLKISQEQQLLLSRSLTNSQALHAGTIKEHIEEKKRNWFLSWLFKKINRR